MKYLPKHIDKGSIAFWAVELLTHLYDNDLLDIWFDEECIDNEFWSYVKSKDFDKLLTAYYMNLPIDELKDEMEECKTESVYEHIEAIAFAFDYTDDFDLLDKYNERLHENKTSPDWY